MRHQVIQSHLQGSLLEFPYVEAGGAAAGARRGEATEELAQQLVVLLQRLPAQLSGRFGG
jgi:hypothetical protein